MGLLDGIIGLKELKAKRKQQSFENEQTVANESDEARSRKRHDTNRANIAHADKRREMKNKKRMSSPGV